MIFQTERLLLRPWRESDAAQLYEWSKDPDVGPRCGWKAHESPEESLEVIRTVLAAPMTWAVCCGGVPVGSIGLFQPGQTAVPVGEAELELGYWICKPLWGRGLIPEAVRALQRYAFQTLGCPALWCGYHDGNVQSRRVQEKCGFGYHHTEENLYNPQLNCTYTEHYTCLTRETWLSMQT